MKRRPSAASEFSFAWPVTQEELDRLRRDVKECAVNGAHAFEIDLGEIAVLEAPIVAVLIESLHTLRQRGGSLHLVAVRPNVLATFRATGLDRIFSVAEIEEPAASRKTGQLAQKILHKAKLPARLRVLMAFMAAGAVFRPLPSLAQNPHPAPTPELSAQAIIARVVEQNPSLRTFRSNLHVELKLQSFPYFRQQLDGQTYFKRPGSYELVFTRVPSFAKGFEKLFSDIGDPSTWENTYHMSVAGERTLNGHKDVVVRLVKKVRGQIDHEDVAVDPVRWRIDDMQWFYYNGGTISMSQDFQEIGGFFLLTAQHATIRIPHVHALAEGTYSDYRTNVAIDESIFTPKNDGSH